jgi:hypothetical protein
MLSNTLFIIAGRAFSVYEARWPDVPIFVLFFKGFFIGEIAFFRALSGREARPEVF